MNEIFLISLPVPLFAPLENTGNIPLGLSAISLHCRNAVYKVTVCEQNFASRYGDALLIDHIVSRSPAMVGFSVTVWNIERTLYLCKQIKEALPKIVIIVGGPDVASDSPWILNSQESFDFAVVGEGESTFELIAQGVPPAHIQGLLTPGGIATFGTIVPQSMQSLDSIHDPFISGMCTMEPNRVIHTEMYRGCKYGCTFCHYNQGRSKRGPIMRSYTQCDEVFNWAKKEGAREVYLLDPSLEQRPDFEEFLKRIAVVNSGHMNIFCELRLESVTDSIAGLLFDAGVRMVETGLQSIHKHVLSSVGRHFDATAFLNGAKALEKRNIDIQTDVMIGLPNDTHEGYEKTLSFVKNAGLGSQVAVFHTQVLPGTPLKAHAKKFGIVHDNKPPYHVVQTSTWGQESMSTALSFAEEYLDMSTAPYAKPLLYSSGECDDKPSYRTFFPQTKARLYTRFDISTSAGAHAFVNDSFDDCATTFSLVLNVKKSQCSIVEIVTGIARLIEKNPFAALCVLLEMNPLYPIDLIDALQEVFLENVKSFYAQEMFPTQPFHNPLRRVFALLGGSYSTQTNSWLDALTQTAGCILTLRGQTLQECLYSITLHSDHLDKYDYVFLDTAGAIQSFEPLSNRCVADPVLADKIVLCGLDNMWMFERELSRVLKIRNYL